MIKERIWIERDNFSNEVIARNVNENSDTKENIMLIMDIEKLKRGST